MAGDEVPQAEEEPVQRPWNRASAGKKRGIVRTHLSVTQWQPLRVLGSGTSRLSQAAVLRTTCRGWVAGGGGG